MAKPKPMMFVAVVECESCYGGPEEGGWWYSAPVAVHDVIKVPEGKAHDLAFRMLSAAKREFGRNADVVVRKKRSQIHRIVEDFRRPHYE